MLFLLTHVVFGTSTICLAQEMKRSPLFGHDADTPNAYHGVSFGLDTPGRPRLDDIFQPSSSFDATPFPVHGLGGSDGPSPSKPMPSPSALEFVSRFNLSRSFSVDDGTESGQPQSYSSSSHFPPLNPFSGFHGNDQLQASPFFMGGLSPSLAHITYSSNIYRNHDGASSLQPSVQPTDSFPPAFLSPPRQSHQPMMNRTTPLPPLPLSNSKGYTNSGGERYSQSSSSVRDSTVGSLKSSPLSISSSGGGGDLSLSRRRDPGPMQPSPSPKSGAFRLQVRVL